MSKKDFDNGRKEGFTQGVVYAIAQCIRFGEEGTAGYLWHESNFEKKDLKCCDEYDTKELNKIF